MIPTERKLASRLTFKELFTALTLSKTEVELKEEEDLASILEGREKIKKSCKNKSILLQTA